MNSPCIVGIDCATVADRVGLALGVPNGDGWRLVDVTTGSRARLPAAVVGAWLVEWPNALLALDAPLGWPAALGHALATHRAGAPIAAAADALFRGATWRGAGGDRGLSGRHAASARSRRARLHAAR